MRPGELLGLGEVARAVAASSVAVQCCTAASNTPHSRDCVAPSAVS